MTAKKSKRALWLSAISLFLCIVMLAGTTFAWFTDSVSSENNIIKAGNLDIELYWSRTADDKDWHKVGESTNIFKDDALWEPGYTEVVYLKVVNEGSLALKYWLGVNVVSETTGANQQGKFLRLSDYIEFGVVKTGDDTFKSKYETREEALAAIDADDYKAISAGYSNSSKLWPKTNAEGKAVEEYATLVVTMPESVGDEANHNGVIIPSINIGLNVFATQLSYEEDSYGSDYDIGTPWAGEIDISWYNTTDNAFVLTTPQQLAGLAEIVNSGADNFSGKLITLGADIDLNNIEWTPIGRFYQKANNTTYTFSGTFDGGDDHTVSNLLITGVKNYVGLFGYTRNNKGEIKNLTVENAKVSGHQNVGTVVGQAYDTKMTNITVTGHVEVNGVNYVGGVVGRGGASNDWADITVNVDAKSYVKADATKYIPGNSNADENGYVHEYEYVGGVLGHMESGARIRKNITSNIDVYGYNHYIGGAFGIVQYDSILENVIVTGDVIGIGETTHIGGIAGGWQTKAHVPNKIEHFLAFTNCDYQDDDNSSDITEDIELFGGYYRDLSNNNPLIIDGKDPDGNWAGISATYLANALKQDGNVKLYQNLSSMHTPLAGNNPPLEVPEGKTVVLDLNGMTAQGVWGSGFDAVLVNNGTLTVKNGTLDNSRAGYGCSVILNKGTLTLQDVTLKGGVWGSGASANYPKYAVDNRGTLTVEAGTTITAAGGGIYTAAGATTEINGGTITISNQKWNVYTSVHVHAIYAGAGSTVTVNGGNFTMGTFTNTSEKKYPSHSGVLCAANEEDLIVKGGTFKGVVKDGVDTGDPTAYVEDGYWVQKAGDKYAVVNKDTVLVNNADELQIAVVTVTDGQTIVFVSDITGDVLVTQREAVDVTIDGSGHKFNGVMTVFGKGKSDTRTETLTIKNINFVAKAGAESCIVSPDKTVYGSYSYSHNVTVDSCTFTDPDGVVDCAAIRQQDGGDENWSILNCSVDSTMHSLVQLNNCEDGLYIYNCTVNSKNGINLNSTINVTIDKCNFDVKGYCVRFGVNTGGNPDAVKSFTISNSTLKSACDDGDALIMFRNDAKQATLTLTNNIYNGTSHISGNTDKTTIIMDGKTQVSSAEKLLDSLKDGGGNVALNGTVDLGGTQGNYLTLTEDTTITGGAIKGTGWTGELNYAVNATSGNIVFDGVTFDTTNWTTEGWANWGISVNINGTANVTFRNCTFIGNQCPIYLSGADAVVTLEGCTFTGGCIQCEIYSGDFQLGQDLIVKGCDFTGLADVLHIYDYDKDPSSDAIAQYLTDNGNIFTGTCKQTCM